jgi:hypothetical protein
VGSGGSQKEERISKDPAPQETKAGLPSSYSAVYADAGGQAVAAKNVVRQFEAFISQFCS